MQTAGPRSVLTNTEKGPTRFIGITFDFSACNLLIFNSLGPLLHDLLFHHFSLEVINYLTPSEIRGHYGEHFLPRHGVEVPRA
jgi:hypothetical protein